MRSVIDERTIGASRIERQTYESACRHRTCDGTFDRTQAGYGSSMLRARILSKSIEERSNDARLQQLRLRNRR